MPYRYSLDGPYIRVWFTGVLTGRDLREVADELRPHESELGHVPDRLVDMSDVVTTGATFELAILAARVRGVQRFPNTFRSALVSPKVEVAGFARIFRALNRNPQITVEVFERVADAEAWLSTPREETPGRRVSDQRIAASPG
jgi:hypothetical protein